MEREERHLAMVWIGRKTFPVLMAPTEAAAAAWFGAMYDGFGVIIDCDETPHELVSSSDGTLLFTESQADYLMTQVAAIRDLHPTAYNGGYTRIAFEEVCPSGFVGHWRARRGGTRWG